MLKTKKLIFTYLFLSLMSLVICGCWHTNSSNNSNQAATNAKVDGVNLGGVFVLEDWFFSAANMGHHVSTPCPYKGSGVASSKIFANSPGMANFIWTSETDLIKKLLQNGYTEEQVADIFKKHRDEFLEQEANGPKSLDANFAKLESMGINLVRLPLTWAITYPDHSYSINPGNDGAPVNIPASDEVQLIPDPFYPQAKWASIPITSIETILKTASAHHIKILLEIHAYPGGSGDGTYNGVWPNTPKFWTTGIDSDNHPIYKQNFQAIFGNLVTWADGLFLRSDKSYANGLAGLSPMNEPAHLMGIPAASCNESSNWGITTPDEVLDTLALAIEDFRHSSLPKKHVKLYMNIIETMFPVTEPNVYKTIGNWWIATTEEKERKNWAVLDIHHYIAWDNKCNTCLQQYVDKNNNITQAGFDQLKQCSSWFATLRQNLGLSENSLLSTSEFSASTNSDTWNSCASGVVSTSGHKPPKNYKEYRNYFINEQITNAKLANIQAYFWAWMIPYNNNFKNEWALYSICSGDNPPKFCGRTTTSSQK